MVDRLGQRRVGLAVHDREALAQKTLREIGAVDERAAAGSLAAGRPEGQLHAVGEGGGTLPCFSAVSMASRLGNDFASSLGKNAFSIASCVVPDTTPTGLPASAATESSAAADLPVGREPGRQFHESSGEGKALTQFRADADPGDDRLPLPAFERGRSSAKVTAWIWHFGFDFKLPANLPHQIDMETGKLARLIDEIERRKIHRRQEAQARQASSNPAWRSARARQTEGADRGRLRRPADSGRKRPANSTQSAKIP